MTKELKSIDPNDGKLPIDGQPPATDCRTIKYEGRTYKWTGKRWVNIDTFTCPPAATTNTLNAILLSRLKKEDEKITGFQQLLDRAKDAKAQTQYGRAEGLVRKALQLSPDNLWVVAILCSCLRSWGKPEEALKELTPYLKEDFPPLLVTRAAALCDLARWEEAMIEITKALSMQQKYKFVKLSEAFRVLNRITTARPDLFKWK